MINELGLFLTIRDRAAGSLSCYDADMDREAGPVGQAVYATLRMLFSARTGVQAYPAYLLARLAFAVLQCFPINACLDAARVIARIWRSIKPTHYNRARAHLTASLGDRYGSGRLDVLAQACLENTVMFVIELVCLPRLVNAFTWRRYISLINFDEVLRMILSGRGFIVVTGHYGPFELPGHLLACLGFDAVAVMRPLDNQPLNEFIVRSRRTHGLRLLDKKGASILAETALQEGAMVAFVGDQDAGAKGVFVDFFGQPASTYKSIGLLAMTVSCPIVVAFARRQGRKALYDIGIQRVIRPEEWQDQADPLRWITQAYTSAIEGFVRERPEQYLWVHRRWKSKPRARAT